jgi:hypothetical protein
MACILIEHEEYITGENGAPGARVLYPGGIDAV